MNDWERLVTETLQDEADPERASICIEARFEVVLGDGSAVVLHSGPLLDVREDQVFIADTEKFVRLWRANPDAQNRPVDHQNLNNPPFPDSANPVRLAEVRLDVKENKNLLLLHDDVRWTPRKGWQQRTMRYSAGLTLVDGYALTLWLLAQGAQRFPLRAQASAGAGCLHRLIGATGQPLYWLADMVD